MRPRQSLLCVLWAAALLIPCATFGPAQAQLQTSVAPALPALPDDALPPHDDSPVICRPGQRQTGSRLLTPPVCKTQRQWDDLHARGLDLNADGKTTFSTSQKYNATNAPVCRNAQDCAP